MSNQPVHKAGPLKQQNKSHKSGRHRSKGSLSRDKNGRVSGKTLSRKSNVELRRFERRNQVKQRRLQKRDAVLLEKRSRGTDDSAPHAVLLAPLNGAVDADDVLRILSSADPSAMVIPRQPWATSVLSSRLKQRFTFLTCPPGDLYALLDAGKVADTVLFIMAAGCTELSEYAEMSMSCLISQGISCCVHAVQGLDAIPQKRRSKTKKLLESIVAKRFPKEKLYSLDTSMDVCNLLRHVAERKPQQVFYRQCRPYMLAEEFAFQLNGEGSTDGTLQISGYVRGKTLDVNQLVHIPGLGDFQMNRLIAAADPAKMSCQQRSRQTSMASESMDVGESTEMVSEMDEGGHVIQVADPSLQESLQSERQLNPNDMDQTWPTEEELAEAEASLRNAAGNKMAKIRVPKGMSEYQSSWLIDDNVDDEEASSDEEHDDDEPPMLTAVDDLQSGGEFEEPAEDFEELTVGGDDAIQYDEEMDLDEEEEQLSHWRAERERQEQLFPDEVDTPLDMPARHTFAGYRGLQSFRTSEWDVKEDLPRDYARIFQFQNFKRARKLVMKKESEDGAPTGWYVTVHVSNVPQDSVGRLQRNSPVVLFGLLPYEHKISVVHYAILKHPTCTAPVQSEDSLIFHSGFRRFKARPIFSLNTAGNKHKLERFLPAGTSAIATVYAPISFPPLPSLLFSESRTGHHCLVATGSLFKVDPDRIVAQKVVLSGAPYKINKRVAVIRNMFFNREDIMWFKQIELWTKYGRRGHINEPLGTHGHMKCLFDGPLKAQDTICMSLYKRVYPQWDYSLHVSAPPCSVEPAQMQAMTTMEDNEERMEQ